MNRFLTAIALTIALPAVAHAQEAPAPAPKAECCEKMKDCCKDKSKMDCCKGMDHSKMDHSQHDMKGGATSHAGHDMSQPDAKTAPADPHANHQR